MPPATTSKTRGNCRSALRKIPKFKPHNCSLHRISPTAGSLGVLKLHFKKAEAFLQSHLPVFEGLLTRSPAGNRPLICKDERGQREMRNEEALGDGHRLLRRLRPVGRRRILLQGHTLLLG